jgi:hypothetical protein
LFYFMTCNIFEIMNLSKNREEMLLIELGEIVYCGYAKVKMHKRYLPFC